MHLGLAKTPRDWLQTFGFCQSCVVSNPNRMVYFFDILFGIKIGLERFNETLYFLISEEDFKPNFDIMSFNHVQNDF